MTLRVGTFGEAYRVAQAAGRGAAGRCTRRAGRGAWNADEHRHAVAEFLRAIRRAGFGDGQCAPDDPPLTVALRECGLQAKQTDLGV